jgi:hypothetical protein
MAKPTAMQTLAGVVGETGIEDPLPGISIGSTRYLSTPRAMREPRICSTPIGS